MTVAVHPTPETLSAFACGALPPAELASVSAHVRGCDACCAALARLPEDTLAGLARAAVHATASTPAPAVPLQAPRHTGIPAALATHPRYQVLSELGAGGMGTVYKAEHRVMGRIVALKVVLPELTAQSSAVERFRKEIQAAARLNHPNIVTAHDADEAEGLHFLVMEYVEGTSLDRLVNRKGPLAVPLAAQFARQVALGLQHAHEKGMVHRDIKPQNLMVTRKGQVKILDFGIARFARTDEPQQAAPGRVPFGAGKPVVHDLTSPNLLMGTPDYLSPEQGKNSHAVDIRSDIYSLGCTLYFLLTGRPPFAHASTLIDKLLAHTEQAPPSLRELRPEVPEGLSAIVAKLMAKKPDDRYTLPAEAAAALLPFTRGPDAGGEPRAAGFEIVDAVVITPAPAESPGPAANAFETDPISGGRTVAEPAKLRKTRRKKPVPWWKQRWAKIGVAVVGLVLLAVLVASAAKKRMPATDDTASDSHKPQQKGNTNPGPGGARPGTPIKDTLPILFVVPSKGVYGPDYFPVVARLKAGGAKVVTTCGSGGPAWVLPQDGAGGSISVDVRFTDVDASQYSAVIFCGYHVDEYIWGSPPPVLAATRQLLESMRAQSKPIAAICVGQRVLANYAVLQGKPAAKSETLLKNFPGVNSGGMTWENKGVVVAPGKVITGAGPEDATAFADAVLKVLP